eukprot:4452749-Heterocapsa_arctica.AAC.1
MAGSARLTAALALEDFDAFGVDHKGNRHLPEGRVIIIDLATIEGQQQIYALLKPGSDVVFVWFGIPCGTMSRARGIRLPNGAPGPQPLRSEAMPLGLPGL